MVANPRINGKVALVTGASRGIGRAIAQRLAAAGATVVVTARSVNTEAAGIRAQAEKVLPGTLAETVALIEATGGRAIPLGADLRNEDELGALVPRTIAAAGSLDILVNNAGFTDFARIERMPIVTFDSTIAHFLRAPFALAQAAIPHMKVRGAGWIVNITSSTSLPVKRPFPEYCLAGGNVIYAASKAALNRFTQGLAAEMLADNIAVNAVGPSTAIRTPGAAEFIPTDYPTEDVEYLAETVLAMCHLPAAQRTGLITYSMHFPHHHELEVRSLDAKTVFPRREPPAWSDPQINPSGD